MTDDKMDPKDDLFARRISSPLRKAERLDGTFDERLLSAIHAAELERSAASTKSVWLRPRTFSISPLAGLAMAAALATILFGAGAVLRPTIDGTRMAAAAQASDTVYMVRFVLSDSEARAVSLIGDFNGWTRDESPLARGIEPGTWVATYALPAGRHEYAFVVIDSSGERWVADPHAARSLDDHGTESSIIRVGDSRAGDVAPR